MRIITQVRQLSFFLLLCSERSAMCPVIATLVKSDPSQAGQVCIRTDQDGPAQPSPRLRPIISCIMQIFATNTAGSVIQTPNNRSVYFIISAGHFSEVCADTLYRSALRVSTLALRTVVSQI
ncbi:hypothetical protein BD310DRAFT_224436 [Dichomitus squalens]|uniref:Secreted protein n=1 Tax=Dichomitus squalens TaxID=114155 RepID=A0A4Q9PCS0_9APHY|nr:hypothetical protein BD310DRAFT_224436 [Dichomitus squalens]